MHRTISERCISSSTLSNVDGDRRGLKAVAEDMTTERF